MGHTGKGATQGLSSQDDVLCGQGFWILHFASLRSEVYVLANSLTDFALI